MESTGRINRSEYTEPFFHLIIDSFLSCEELIKIKQIYTGLTFKPIRTDLYRFNQTAELNRLEGLHFFRDALDCVFRQHSTLDHRTYDIFASYYEKGDYLLCHDDVVGDRLFAFTFYFEDYEGGDLILYKEDCRTVSKRVAVRENRLVVFQVGATSFHEVAICPVNGRKAFTGWFNRPNIARLPWQNERGFTIPSNLLYFPLDVHLSENGAVLMEFEDVCSKITSVSISGPFIDRRCKMLHLAEYYVPNISGYKLLHCECLSFSSDSYILCNDKINSIDGPVLDIFIFSSQENCTREADRGGIKDFINYVDADGNIVLSVDVIPGHMFVIQRTGLNVCIMRRQEEVTLKHFLYMKIEVSPEHAPSR